MSDKPEETLPPLDRHADLERDVLPDAEPSHRQLFEASRDACIVLDAGQGRLIRANPAALQLLGLASLGGRTLFDVSPGFQPGGQPSRELGMNLFERILAQGVGVSGWRFAQPNGRHFDAEIWWSCFVPGTQMLLQATVRELTPRQAGAALSLKFAKAFEPNSLAAAPVDPLAIQAEAAGARPRAARHEFHPALEAAAALRARHAGTRALVVEDNRVNRELAVAMLASAGLAVDTAADGLEALDKARAGCYGLVLMDVAMPRMDGLDATRAIRALPGWGGVPVLALTANAFNEERMACLAAGMNAVLSKPADLGLLYRTLLQWLEGPAPAAAGC
ncbi:ATP-binding response regulator [Azohydromonas australica]|uniref:ATP-binding response regulator n=1 Tax=Azohydromonas australica TaxID=364039 RepID=UPI000413DE22|nr:response regulator [Azohydromonas australica]